MLPRIVIMHREIFLPVPEAIVLLFVDFRS